MSEPKSEYRCNDCDAILNIPEDPLVNELVTCERCGAEYIVKKDNGGYKLEDAGLEGEDWGE